MLGKFVLWFSGAMFIAYGLACLANPQLPMAYAGLGALSGDALPEVAAMYGGLQTGFGVFCLVGALRAAYYRPALLLLALCIGALGLARCYWGITGEAAVGSYTYGAAAYELTTTLLACIALRQR
ncbi:MAG: DUF4345 family protein [Halieaceae bacterium]|nr:DUF4345 family protein [Halieaceae bacterium]